MGHTPGPWESHHQKMDSVDHEWSLQTPDHAFLLFNFSPTLSPDECKANARLIAAAPDMLSYCKLMAANGDPDAVELVAKAEAA